MRRSGGYIAQTTSRNHTTRTITQNGLAAQENYGWAVAKAGDHSIACQLLKSVLDDLETLQGHEGWKARLWWELGACHWALGAREEAHRYFVTALKRFPTFAPAFTSLGVYYIEHASPPDFARALKCFQKAFELDPRDSEAGRLLVAGLASEGEWGIVGTVAERFIENQIGSSVAGNFGARKQRPHDLWAWKARGMADMYRRDFVAAVTAFQTFSRANPNDALIWLHLGEAYFKAGQHSAALKALHRSREWSKDKFMSLYLLGLYLIGEVQRDLGQFSAAIANFESVLYHLPDELASLNSLVETYIALGRSERSAGYVTRGEESFIHAIIVASRIFDAHPNFKHIAWKAVSDALLDLSQSAFLSDSEQLIGLCEKLVPLASLNSTLDGLFIQPIITENTVADGLFAAKAATMICSHRVSLFGKNDKNIGSAYFDLALALHRTSRRLTSSAVKEKAELGCIDFLKRALCVHAANVSYWTALAHYTFSSRPALAQHAFIRALEVDARDAQAWAGLGLFYLHHGDPELANQSFMRAEMLDPDCALPWMGLGILAKADGRTQDALNILQHATSLLTDVPGIDLEYASSAFRASLRSHCDSTDDTCKKTFLPLFFCLDRYCRRHSDDATALHLFGLVCERLGHEQPGVDRISEAIRHLEVAYEDSEDPVIERRYAIAHCNLGRLLVVTDNHTRALEAFDTAFSLLQHDSASLVDTSLRVMCRIGSGLAHFHSGDVRDAVLCMESALHVAASDPLVRGHVAVLLAQSLWVLGDNASIESATTLLLEYITQDPENMEAVMTLAALGLLTDDDALMDAALSELHTLPPDTMVERSSGSDVGWMLRAHAVAEGNYSRALSIDQQLIHIEPWKQEARQALASQLIRLRLLSHAQNILRESTKAHDLNTLHISLRLYAVSLAYNEELSKDEQCIAVRMAQKSIKLAPWELDSWRSMAFVRHTAR